jgi:hypothetical protein
VLVALELALELAVAAALDAALLVLLELLPQAPTASARTPTAANVPDHALTFIRSSTFAPVASPPADGQRPPACSTTVKRPALTFDKICTTSAAKAQGS